MLVSPVSFCGGKPKSLSLKCNKNGMNYLINLTSEKPKTFSFNIKPERGITLGGVEANNPESFERGLEFVARRVLNITDDKNILQKIQEFFISISK